MMHRLFLPAVGALALALAIPAPADAGMGGGGGGNGIGLGLGGGAGHGIGLGGGGHGSIGLGAAATGDYGSMSHGFGSGPGTIGLGGGRGSVGLGLTRGIGSPGGDDLHLGLGSHELGLGNNFGLDAPDNVLSRAARVGTSPTIPGIGASAGDRPSPQGLDLGTNGDSRHSSQNAKGSQASGDGSKTNSFKKEGEQAARSTAVEEQLQLLQQSQPAAERAADLPPTPTPPSPAASTTAINSPSAATLPETLTPVVTTSLGSGEVQMIGAYFAQNGAPVASIPTSSVNVSVGGTVPESVALFPPPYDLVSQISDPDFLYFVWGNNVVIVDGQTNVVSAIVPDVLAHQD
jgi:hypothetical protein